MSFGFVVRETVAATMAGITDEHPQIIIYSGELDEYKGGIGAFDEGDYYVYRWAVKVVNLTPHDITWVDGDRRITVPKTGSVARVSTTAEPIESRIGLPLVRTTYGQVEGLPEPEEGTVYIVSALVLNALRDAGVRRTDVIAPDTGPESVVRDSDGRIVGVRRFMVV